MHGNYFIPLKRPMFLVRMQKKQPVRDMDWRLKKNVTTQILNE